jgi:hypothetical protein
MHRSSVVQKTILKQNRRGLVDTNPLISERCFRPNKNSWPIQPARDEWRLIQMDNQTKQDIISQHIRTAAGRQRLAASIK